MAGLVAVGSDAGMTCVSVVPAAFFWRTGYCYDQHLGGVLEAIPGLQLPEDCLLDELTEAVFAVEASPGEALAVLTEAGFRTCAHLRAFLQHECGCDTLAWDDAARRSYAAGGFSEPSASQPPPDIGGYEDEDGGFVLAP